MPWRMNISPGLRCSNILPHLQESRTSSYHLTWDHLNRTLTWDPCATFALTSAVDDVSPPLLLIQCSDIAVGLSLPPGRQELGLRMWIILKWLLVQTSKHHRRISPPYTQRFSSVAIQRLKIPQSDFSKCMIIAQKEHVCVCMSYVIVTPHGYNIVQLHSS